MHAAYGRNSADFGGEAIFHASFPDVRPKPSIESASPRFEYGASRRPNWAAIGFIAALHAAALVALVKLDVIHVHKARPVITVVELIAEPPPPPTTPELDPKPPVPHEPQIVAPPPVVQLAAPPPAPVHAVDVPPAQAVVVAPAAPKAAPTGPVSVADLSSTMISSPNPRIPYESRKRREGGTVYVLVTVGLDGRVAEAGISKSSGFAALDKAVLEAVRKWRWSPTIRSGQPVMVRGIVDVTINPPA